MTSDNLPLLLLAGRFEDGLAYLVENIVVDAFERHA